MIIIRGIYEITELFVAVVACVGLHLASCNVFPMRYIPELPSALFVFTNVILLSYVRVRSFTPLKSLIQFFIELVVIYAICQTTLFILWEPSCMYLELIRDKVMSTRQALSLYKDMPKLFLFIRLDFFYFVKLSVISAVTYKSLKVTQSLDYVLPWRRNYHYFSNSSNICFNMIYEDVPDRRRGMGNFCLLTDLPTISSRNPNVRQGKTANAKAKKRTRNRSTARR